MCGIGGILRFSSSGAASRPDAHSAGDAAIPDSWLDAIDSGIVHRGPDGHGRWRGRSRDDHGRIVDIAMVHRRLSIIDHAGGQQPMVTPSNGGEAAIVFNGCIYNHRVLRAELARLGRPFASDHSDTEVLLQACLHWGDAASGQLEGMYAAAVWQQSSPTRTGQLLLMRDAAGEKPLYLAGPFAYAGGDVWAFASTVPALTRWARAAGVRLELDAGALEEWIRLGWCARTPWTKIREIGPGETWIVGEARPRITRSLDATRSDARGFESASEADSAIADCVKARLEADVPLGCFLSGGVDSSLVALHARRALGSLRTFTVRMDDPRYDESAFAQQAAATIGSTHETIDVRADPATDLPRLIGELGLPFGDSSLLPTHWVSRAARKFVPVALGGDGGDELFMGYDRHTLGWIARWRWLAALRPISWLDRRDPKGWADKLARLVVACRGAGYADLIAIFQTPELQRLLGAQTEQLTKLVRKAALSDIRLNDVRSYLPFDLLRKSDTASMSIALEVRSPLLDRTLAARALATPESTLLRGGRKGLLREAAKLHFDAALIDRPKMGFAIPVGEWLRRDVGRLGTMLQDRLSSTDPFGDVGPLLQIKVRECARLAEEHNRGVRDHSQRLYMLLVMSIWADTFAGSAR